MVRVHDHIGMSSSTITLETLDDLKLFVAETLALCATATVNMQTLFERGEYITLYELR